MKRKYLIISIVCLLLSGGINAQVTIGSGTKPVPGALLDLKDGGSYGATGATAVKGLGLPRVKLSDIAKLKMGTNEILDTDNGGEQYKKHTGLIVYNVSGEAIPKCAPIPDGLYVWDGAKWTGINVAKADPATLTLSGTDINFASGLDLRPIPTTAETFNVAWTPSDKPVAYTNVVHATWGGISFNAINTPPANGNLTTNPTTFSLLPTAMTAADIATNVFRTKQNTLTFTVANECGSPITEVRVVNQTNKALTVSTPYKEYTASATNETNTLTTNADWQLASIMPNDGTNAISNVRVGSPAVALPTNTTQTGYEQNNNVGKAATLTYDIAVAASKARYSTLTFADAAATKRFSDVTITVLQCTNVGQNPTIEQWALTAGFTQTEIDDVKSTGTDSRKLPTGIQMHRIAANTPRGTNQIFLSSNFGANPQDDDARWMIHNLDAKAYDGVTHSAGRALTGPNGNTSNPNNTAYWAYPKPAGTIAANNDAAERPTYDKNQRLGLLYTWDAATAGKGGSNGQLNLTEGEPATHTAVQGICPSGWHLPSDVEWTTLEKELATNTSKYSSTANVGDNITVDGTSWRGTLHGKAMKEVCEPTDGAKTHQGTSNGINSTDRPGFDALLAGRASDGSASYFGTTGYFWSASGGGTSVTWYRNFKSGVSQVYRNGNNRYNLFSVRCKK